MNRRDTEGAEEDGEKWRRELWDLARGVVVDVPRRDKSGRTVGRGIGWRLDEFGLNGR